MFEPCPYCQEEPRRDQRNLVLTECVKQLESAVGRVHGHRQAPSNAVRAILVTQSPNDVLTISSGELIPVVQVVGTPEFRIERVTAPVLVK